MIIPTMTLNELAERMRSLGLHVSNDTLGAAIEAGLYPFAIAVRKREGGQRNFEIYKVLFDRWVAERMVLEPGDPGYQTPLELCPQHTTQEAS